MQNNDSLDVKKDQAALTVLLVEDDDLSASLLEYLFTRHGFHVQLAKDGEQARAIIESDETPPHLIMLDLTLPYVDGYELLQLIRNRPNWQKIPVLVLSGKSQEEDVVRAFKLGASDFMAKPFYPNELIMRITRFKNEGVLK